MKQYLVVAAVSLLASSYTHAQSLRFYAGADMGFTQLESKAEKLGDKLANRVAETDVNATINQKRSAASNRAYVGLKLSESFGLELGRLNTKAHSLSVVGNVPGIGSVSGEGRLSVSGTDFSMLVRPSVSSGLNGLFIRLGAHNYELSASAQIKAGSKSEQAAEKGNVAGVLAGVGYDFALTSNIGLRLSATKIHLGGSNGFGFNNYTAGLKIGF